MTLRTRIAVIVAVTVAALLVAVGVSAQLLSARALVGAVDEDLRRIAASIERDPRGLLVVAGPGRDRFGGAAGIVQLVDVEGRVIGDLRSRLDRGGVTGGDADADRVVLPVDDVVLAVASGASPSTLRTVPVEDVPLRMLVVPVGERFALQVARPIDEVEDVIGQLRARTALLTLAGSLLAALIAWTVAGRSIRPVSELTAAVEEVRDGRDLSRRVVVPEGDDEVARLARAFDAMLSRLEASRVAQDRLAADASHELRTPLTSLRTNVEVLVHDAERLAADDRRRLTEDVVGQLEELSAMVDGLVTLTRVDTDPDAHGPVDLAELTEDVVTSARRRYPARAADLRLTVGTDVRPVEGDERELALAVSAVVDNAVKYAPAGAIDVTVRADPAGTVHVEVADEGPGVPPDALPHLFKRFFRAPEARGMPGAGLGLALVERVARAHGGTAAVTARTRQGLRVSLELPVRPGRPLGGAPAQSP